MYITELTEEYDNLKSFRKCHDFEFAKTWVYTKNVSRPKNVCTRKGNNGCECILNVNLHAGHDNHLFVITWCFSVSVS